MMCILHQEFQDLYFYQEQLKEIIEENQALRRQLGYNKTETRLIGKSAAIKDILSKIHTLASVDSNILIHEKVELKGKMKRMELGYDILHHKSHDFGDFKKVINHTRIHARRSNIKAQLLLIISILWGYSMKGGFLDGYDGFRYHLFKIYYSFCVIYFIIKNWLIMIANKGDN